MVQFIQFRVKYSKFPFSLLIHYSIICIKSSLSPVICWDYLAYFFPLYHHSAHYKLPYFHLPRPLNCDILPAIEPFYLPQKHYLSLYEMIMIDIFPHNTIRSLEKKKKKLNVKRKRSIKSFCIEKMSTIFNVIQHRLENVQCADIFTSMVVIFVLILHHIHNKWYTFDYRKEQEEGEQKEE